jgi:hypothetical protein
MSAPEGFAPIPDRRAFRAVSPEGVRFRMRTVENDPEQSLEFWSKALRSHLEKEGYPSSGEPTTFSAGEQDGVAFEWVMPYANETWSYLTAIVVSGGRIYIAEAAGEYQLYQSYRQAILDSLSTLDP